MTSRHFLLFGAFLLLGAAEAPKPPPLLPPAEAAKQGRALVTDLLSQRPSQNLTNTGILRTRDAKGRRLETPVTFEIVAGTTNWLSLYRAGAVTNRTAAVRLLVVHAGQQPNEYHLLQDAAPRTLNGSETMIPFAASDFWVADLGLEFLHWPEQRVLKKEIRRGQSCNVLESVNPIPAGGYARVKSWIDIDTGGIIYAEAYDPRGKLLKEFAPKSIKKVRGEWQLQEMEMENRQTGSRTWIEFDLPRK
jgi:hypothetical protein